MDYNILVIDDHPIVCDGICNLLSRMEGIKCIPKNDITNIYADIESTQADLCILDLSLPDINGFHLIETIHEKTPSCSILIYTMHEEPWIIEQLSNFDIQGAVSKSDPIHELYDAVQSIKNNTNYFSHTFMALENEKKRAVTTEVPELSKREKEVLNYISQGMSTTQMAELMFLSINTIQTYRKRLMAKLDAKNVAELVYKGKDLF